MKLILLLSVLLGATALIASLSLVALPSFGILGGPGNDSARNRAAHDTDVRARLIAANELAGRIYFGSRHTQASDRKSDSQIHTLGLDGHISNISSSGNLFALISTPSPLQDERSARFGLGVYRSVNRGTSADQLLVIDDVESQLGVIPRDILFISGNESAPDISRPVIGIIGRDSLLAYHLIDTDRHQDGTRQTNYFEPFANIDLRMDVDWWFSAVDVEGELAVVLGDKFLRDAQLISPSSGSSRQISITEAKRLLNEWKSGALLEYNIYYGPFARTKAEIMFGPILSGDALRAGMALQSIDERRGISVWNIDGIDILLPCIPYDYCFINIGNSNEDG